MNRSEEAAFDIVAVVVEVVVVCNGVEAVVVDVAEDVDVG